MSLFTPLFAACGEEGNAQGCPGEEQVLYLRPHAHHQAAPHLERDVAELLTPHLLPSHQTRRLWSRSAHGCPHQTGGRAAISPVPSPAPGPRDEAPTADTACSSPRVTPQRLQMEKSAPPTLPGGHTRWQQRRYLREGFVQREPAAERHDAGQLVLARESRVQRQGTALRHIRRVSAVGGSTTPGHPAPTRVPLRGVFGRGRRNPTLRPRGSAHL